MAGPTSRGVDNNASSLSWARLIALALLLLILILLGLAAAFFPPASATVFFTHSIPALFVAKEALMITTAVIVPAVTLGAGLTYNRYQGFIEAEGLLQEALSEKGAVETTLDQTKRAKAEAEQAKAEAERAKAEAERAKVVAEGERDEFASRLTAAQEAALELLKKEYLRLADESLGQKKTILAMRRLLAKLELEAERAYEDVLERLHSKEKGSGKLHNAVLDSIQTMLVPKKMQVYDQDLLAHCEQVARNIEVEARAIRTTLETELLDAHTHEERVELLQHKIKHRKDMMAKLAPTLREVPELFAEVYAYIHLHETYAVLAATDKKQVHDKLGAQSFSRFDFSRLRELLLGERKFAHQISTPARALLHRGVSRGVIQETPPRRMSRGRSSSVAGGIPDTPRGSTPGTARALDDSVFSDSPSKATTGRRRDWRTSVYGKGVSGRLDFGEGDDPLAPSPDFGSGSGRRSATPTR